MPVLSQWIDYGDQRGFLAWPDRATRPLPSILVVQEVWGVEAQIEDVTRRIAAAGYVALAPDLFAVSGVRPAALSAERIDQAQKFAHSTPPGALFDPARRDVELARLPEPQRSQVLETFQEVFKAPARLPSYVAPLRQAVAHLKGDLAPSRGQKVGCVGFCMGGGLSALLSCEEPEVSAAAVFYGNAPAETLIPRTRCPVLGFYAGNDQKINQGIPGFEAAMKACGRSFEAHVYPGVNHAFFNEVGPSYDADASRDSFVRLLAFFRDHLAP